ncbi:PCNA-interacting partner-like [Lytechinus variegatus]|uniref:PCNA-interacting partner-like n=1 Tax=Lytechinus variegatus TaxID=7654 RepID=UPI001BB14822|nr:PCNA-interacting partner-like [Lytechinus variegatus]
MMDLKEAISSSPDDILVMGNHGNQSHDTILRHLNSVSCDLQLSDHMDVHLLGSRTKSSGYPKLCTLAQHFIERYRHHGLAANDRQTVLSHSSHLLMVQLCLAERSKQKHDLFEVDMSEVLLTSRELLQQKLSTNQLSCTPKPTNDSSSTTPESHPLMNMYEGMLKRCNMVDMVDVWREVRKAESKRREEETNGSLAESKTKFVILHPPQGDIECTMLSSLSGNERPSTITALTFDPSSPSTDEEGCEDVMRLEVSTERLSWDQGMSALHDFQSASTPSARSPTETFCRQLFLSHLALLINTRDELSLAHCLSLPDKGLGIEGFTALRKAAQEKNMPMFQTMVSFIMKLRLGGKSYAPDLSSPLGEYVKPMGDFVNLIQKMQTLTEETKDPREAIKKILHTIKISILKSSENVLKAGSLEKAVADLTRETDYLIINYTEEKTPKKIVGQGRVIYGQKTIYVIRNLVDRQSGAYMSKLAQTQLLTDTVCSQKTPVKLPSVISQFRTPDVECDPDSPENVSLRERLRKSLGGDEEASKTPQVHGSKSFMIWAEPVVKITSINGSPPANQKPDAQIQANQNKGLWADSPDDRSLAHKKRLSGLTPDLIDSIVSTPKRKTHLIVESVDETENTTDDGKVKDVKKKNKKNKEMSKKRLILNELNADDSQPAKKAKKAEPKPKKKKTVQLVKGQQTLNRFFRV